MSLRDIIKAIVCDVVGYAIDRYIPPIGENYSTKHKNIEDLKGKNNDNKNDDNKNDDNKS